MMDEYILYVDDKVIMARSTKMFLLSVQSPNARIPTHMPVTMLDIPYGSDRAEIEVHGQDVPDSVFLGQRHFSRLFARI